jgi:hypothetical protein
MGLVEADLYSIHWGQEDGRAADNEDVGGQPCQVEVLGEEVVEERNPYVQVAGMSHWQAAVKWAVANG